MGTINSNIIEIVRTCKPGTSSEHLRGIDFLLGGFPEYEQLQSALGNQIGTVELREKYEILLKSCKQQEKENHEDIKGICDNLLNPDMVDQAIQE